MRSFQTISALLLSLTACAGAEDDSTPAPAPSPEPGSLAAKADNGMDELCAWISEERDEVCLAQCVEVDPDCEGLTDHCEANGYYGDGFCDRTCEQPDPDCVDEPTPDACLEEYRYADGPCDEDCAWQDPDCDGPGDAPRDGLAEWEVAVCSRLNLDDPRVDLNEFATSLCIEREDEALVDCVAHCVRVYHAAQSSP